MIYKNVMRCHIIKVMAKMLISSSWYYLLLQYSLVLDPPREGNGNPLQYSCLGNLTDRGAWKATVHEAAKNQTQLRD